MIYISLVTFNVAIGNVLMFIGFSTLQSIYFSALITALIWWGTQYLSETKKANTHGNE